jgi:hypothetical protein
MEISIEERNAIRSIAKGKSGDAPQSAVIKLMQRNLVWYDGQSYVLTDAGRALSHWCR